MTRYTKGLGFGPFKIKRPGALTDNVVVTYGNFGVGALTRDGVAYSYSYADSGLTRTTTVSDPSGGSRVYVGDKTTFLVSSFRNDETERRVIPMTPTAA